MLLPRMLLAGLGKRPVGRQLGVWSIGGRLSASASTNSHDTIGSTVKLTSQGKIVRNLCQDYATVGRPSFHQFRVSNYISFLSYQKSIILVNFLRSRQISAMYCSREYSQSHSSHPVKTKEPDTSIPSKAEVSNSISSNVSENKTINTSNKQFGKHSKDSMIEISSDGSSLKNNPTNETVKISSADVTAIIDSTTLKPAPSSDNCKQKAEDTMDSVSSVLPKEERPKSVFGYVMSRYTFYIDRLQESFKTGMPKTFRVVTIFSVGLKAFSTDLRDFITIMGKLMTNHVRLEQLTRHQLELWHWMPRDIVKVFPVLAISSIPFGQNVGLPLGYLFPRQLLCRHFWDLQQSHDFAMRDLKTRLYNARPVFRCLQARVKDIYSLPDRLRAQSMCHQLGSGVHPTALEVFALQPLFREEPYSISNIRRANVKALIGLHGLSSLPGLRGRLHIHASWLRYHDNALLKETEGDLTTLHVNTLKASLLIRAISPIGLDSSAMVEVLQRWLAVTQHLTREDASLILHLPVLLYYNHPTNMALVA